ncbi:copper resistance D family protein [Microbacterium sp. NPDC058345]|uniref:copper resistance D family protein n=1 Tax=Microbacterium sp. NPDC058345 TaxID=3346455 RepID=UPI00366427D6
MTVLVQSAAADETIPYALPAAWRGITKWAYFVGFTMVMGSTVVHSLALRSALRSHETSARNTMILRQRSAIVLAISGVIFLLSLWPQLAGKAARASENLPYDRALLPESVWAYLTASAGGSGIPLGSMVLVQFATFAICALLLVSLLAPASRRHVDLIAGVAAIGTAIASVSLGLSGDLVARDADGWMARLPSYVHVLAGSIWVGGLIALALLGTARRRLTAPAGLIWAHMWDRFSRIAQVCVAGIILSGLWMVWSVVSTPMELVTTTFGRILLLKIVLVGILIAIGVFNEYVMIPRIARLRASGDQHGLFAMAVRHFPQIIVLEATIGFAVLLVVPFLNGSAREESGAGEAHATSTMFFATAALIVILVISFALNSRLQAAIERARGEGVPNPEAHLALAGESGPQEHNPRA